MRAALERLKPYEASITEAVDFFIKFAKPPKGKVTIQEAMDTFERDNKRRGLSVSYLTKSRSLFAQFRDKFKNCLTNEVTVHQAREYIYGNADWSGTSKNSHIRHLRALYSLTMKADHVTINPFKDVAFVKEGESKVPSKVLPVDDAQQLLDFALESGRTAECAALALVCRGWSKTGHKCWSKTGQAYRGGAPKSDAQWVSRRFPTEPGLASSR